MNKVMVSIDPVTAIFKRAFDIVLALTGLLLTLPLFPIIAFAIKLNSLGQLSTNNYASENQCLIKHCYSIC